jgi:GR25 family glycosyltransferase involved in LPS biosynthesis
MMTCPGRETFANYVIERIPNLIISYDNFTDPGKFKNTSYKNAQKAWKLAGEEACVQLEDDIILCNNFITKIEKAISKRPNDVIQFFSMRKKDLEIGSRYELGSTFLMHQCYYLPPGMSKKIFEFSKVFENECKQDEHISPNDLVTRYYFQRNKIKYWIHIPSLVDHRIAKSSIDSRRSSKRQSKTFKL